MLRLQFTRVAAESPHAVAPAIAGEAADLLERGLLPADASLTQTLEQTVDTPKTNGDL